jgi:hypothetical protein
LGFDFDMMCIYPSGTLSALSVNQLRQSITFTKSDVYAPPSTRTIDIMMCVAPTSSGPSYWMDALSLTTRFAKPVYTFLTSLHENSAKEYNPLGSSCYLTGNPSQGYVISMNTDVQGQPHTTIMMSAKGNVTT